MHRLTNLGSILFLLVLPFAARGDDANVPAVKLPAVKLSARQIAWTGDWEAAFALAKTENKPVMVCINSLDSEQANKRAATKIYRDADFVKATRDFVMIVVSTLQHRPSGACPRFGVVTCKQHFDCWKELSQRHGETFLNKKAGMKMISPQHAWFRPDGTLIRRKEYELSQAEILKRMRAVYEEVTGKKASGQQEEEVEGKPAEGSDDDRKKPLDARDQAELERAQKPGKSNEEGRRAAVANLLATEKYAAIAAVTELLPKSTTAVKCDILRALGKGQIVDSLDAIHERLHKDKDALVRSFAAVAIEDIGKEESISELLTRLKKEKDTNARKNVIRALGVCGGGVASKDAAKVLLKAITSEKQVLIRKHAAFACKSFDSDDAKKLVLKKLESLAGKLKDDETRGAVVYTLAYIGDLKSTLPVFEKLKKKFQKSKDRWRVSFMRSAIRVLKGEDSEFGRAARFLFRDDRNDPARE